MSSEFSLHRREALSLGAAAIAFAGAARAQTVPAAGETYVNQAPGYGPLVSDPNGLFDLPEGFSYHVVSQGGQTMDDGLLVPGQFDG
ncbi:MAG: phosphatase, partial [Brevundimonas sp.]